MYGSIRSFSALSTEYSTNLTFWVGIILLLATDCESPVGLRDIKTFQFTLAKWLSKSSKNDNVAGLDLSPGKMLYPGAIGK